MPKKKEKKKWQQATWFPKKKKRKREERKKKCNLNWGYLCKVHLLALFPSHFPPKLGG